jgi:hypothetical protein
VIELGVDSRSLASLHNFVRGLGFSFGFLLLDVKIYLDTTRDSGGVEGELSEIGRASSWGLEIWCLGFRD